MYKSTERAGAQYTKMAAEQHGNEGQTEKQSTDQIQVAVDKLYKPPSSKHVTGRLLLAIVGATMGSFQFGYNLGVINAPEKLIKEFMNATTHARTGSDLHDAAQTNLWALTVAIYSAGGCLGGVSAGWWATRFGRRGGCIMNLLIGVLASVLMFASKRAESYEMIIIGRFIIGIHCGLYTGLVPLYLSELSTPGIRGAVGVLHQLAVVTGLLVSQVLGFPVILGTRASWDFLLGLAIVPCLVQGVILPFCPESHRFLLLTRGDEAASRKALLQLRGSSDVEDEIQEMKAESDICENQMSIVELLRLPSLRQPLIIGIVMQLSQQFSGINGVFFYSTSLFEDAGQSEQTAKYTTSAVGGTMVLMTLVTVPLMDRAGRRTLHLAGLAGMMGISAGVTFTLAFRSEVGWFVEASIALTLLYVLFFALGPGSIPWLIISELFAHDARPAALSVCVLVNWASSFVVSYLFPLLQSGIKDFVFLPFTVLLALFVTFTFLKVPETKGKTYEEIAALWRSDKSSTEELGLGKENYGATTKA
ncbi:hypothetical protein EGW08_004473 [Elysia chlorotica]|uniref:Major facilitator superfamily (MFS) profile domain-containing protein n=1 Tax=Elysia chlorotica TaxID=188477 RepID=A0A433U1P1_ELYCH|nr:hypothetical protein EGW08_004473 [Elysia chlorotica]